MLSRLRSMRTITRLLTDAEAIANREGDRKPGAEHAVVAALRLPEGSAARVFASYGLTDEDLLREVRQIHQEDSGGPGIGAAATIGPVEPAGRLYDAQRSVRTLLDATRAAFHEHPSSVLTGTHVLIAASEIEDGTLPRALDRLGIDRADLRRRAVDAAPA